MKDEVLALVRALPDPVHKLNLLREYLQACVLRSFHESEAFVCIAFVGGTALRFVYGLPRFSEDLDFSLENKKGYEPEEWLKKVKRDLTAAGFDAAVRWNDRKNVQTAWIRVPTLLKEAGLSDLKQQNLSIKLEIDTHPPAGASSLTGVINRHVLFSTRYHDLPSLMAGKIHALVTRSYPKGRDWYDLLWYRAKRPPVEPNQSLLQNALDQTEGPGAMLAAQWTTLVLARLETLNEKKLKEDVESFLERREEAALLTKASLRSTLRPI